MTDFFVACLGLFNDTFNAMWEVPVLRLLLFFPLLAVVLLLVCLLSYSARKR